MNRTITTPALTPGLRRMPRHARRGAASKAVVFWVAAIAFGAGTVAAMMLFGNITKRKMEAESNVLKIADLTETTIDPAEWGKNFPRQFDGYIRTSNNASARGKWSEGRPPEDAMLNGVKKSDSKLETDPRLRTIFNGYAFAIDYRERRGHAFMLDDQRDTQRVKQKPQPGACLNCHASNVVAFRQHAISKGAPGTLNDPLDSENGRKQLFAGWEDMNHMTYAEATNLVKQATLVLFPRVPFPPLFLRSLISSPAFRASSNPLFTALSGSSQTNFLPSSFSRSSFTPFIA